MNLPDELETLFGVLFGLAAFALAIGFLIFWILMLINAARQERWGWFVMMLLIEPLALVYRFTAYASPDALAERRRARRGRAKARIAELERKVEDLGGDP